MKKIEVIPHDPLWREAFKAEASQITASLGEIVLAIHHIGSTAIPGIFAKPVLDLLMEVSSILELDAQRISMESLGYEVMGEFGIAGRRYFRKDNEVGIRTHQVHAYEAGTSEITRHLAFRDYLRAHPADAQQYSELKQQLAAEHPHSMNNYVDGKDGFIKDIDQKAARWRGQQFGFK